MDALLHRLMQERGDELLPAQAYLDSYGYEVDKVGAVPHNS